MCGIFFFLFFLIHTDFRSDSNTIYSTTEFSVTSVKTASAENKDLAS